MTRFLASLIPSLSLCVFNDLTGVQKILNCDQSFDSCVCLVCDSRDTMNARSPSRLAVLLEKKKKSRRPCVNKRVENVEERNFFFLETTTLKFDKFVPLRSPTLRNNKRVTSNCKYGIIVGARLSLSLSLSAISASV